MGAINIMWSRVAVLLVSLSASCHAGLLGAGTGEGSCPAAPFRANAAAIKWTLGCPAGAECCTEYGYCRSQAEWVAGAFRDCNGVSNGRELPADAIAAENEAAAYGDTAAAGLIYVPAGASGYAAAPVAAAPAVAVAAAPAVATGYGYAGVAANGFAVAAPAPAAAVGYAAAAPAAVGYAAAAPAGYGYAAAVPAAGYGYAAAANTGYIVNGY